MNEGSPRLPTVVIGGWLGAGKTTLLNHLLRHAQGRRIAVLVNDFGSVNIDADLIEGGDAEAGVLALSGGCLCCSFGDDLVGTLSALARRKPAPDAVLIELSGVALPASVVRTARLSPAVDIVGTLVLADASDVQGRAADRYVGDTVRQQLAQADWLLPSKTDLLTATEAAAALTWLQAQARTGAPAARVLAVRPRELPVELLLGWRADRADQPEPTDHADAAAWASRPIGVPAHAAASQFDSRSLPLPDGTDLQALGARLADAATGVLRAKGLARDAQGQGWQLQVAAGRVLVSPAAVRGPGRLVVIGLRDGWNPEGLLATVGA